VSGPDFEQSKVKGSILESEVIENLITKRMVHITDHLVSKLKESFHLESLQISTFSLNGILRGQRSNSSTVSNPPSIVQTRWKMMSVRDESSIVNLSFHFKHNSDCHENVRPFLNSSGRLNATIPRL
jgi:hypothetical protein